MRKKEFRSARALSQTGSIVVYVLIAIFLTGMLIASMTQGAKKSATTEQIDELMMYLQVDIKTILTSVAECAQVYSKATDGVVNPNTPFPMYGAGADVIANLSSAGAGTAVTNARCPGAPDGQRTIFSPNIGNSFKVLSDTATYTTTFFNDATEGVYVRITRATPDALWAESILRLDGKYSECSAAAVTAAGTCANGCFYYWFVRQPTSVLGGEAGCP